MDFGFDYNEEKNQLLKESRGVSFENVVEAIDQGKLLANLPHFKNSKYKNQFLFLIELNNYVYVVPYVKNKESEVYFLKTIYPSRKFTKKYLNK